MRELTMNEIQMVAGAGDDCASDSGSGNDYGGVTDTSSLGTELIEIYEGVVAAASHIIERVAGAL